MTKFVFERGEITMGKGEKRWLPAFPPFPHNVLKSFLLQRRYKLELYGKLTVRGWGWGWGGGKRRNR